MDRCMPLNLHRCQQCLQIRGIREKRSQRKLKTLFKSFFSSTLNICDNSLFNVDFFEWDLIFQNVIQLRVLFLMSSVMQLKFNNAEPVAVPVPLYGFDAEGVTFYKLSTMVNTKSPLPMLDMTSFSTVK